MNIILRVFSIIFYVIGGLFLATLAFNFSDNHASWLAWRPTWVSWLTQGVLFVFLGYVARLLEKLESRF